jgi:hypothetical protein
MSRFSFKIAQESDDCAIRKVFQDTPMDGKVGVTFKREPSYFDAAKIGNEFHQTIIATDGMTNDIVGLGSRSIKPGYINGEVTNIGYLSSLRIKDDYCNNILLARGYEYLNKLHRDKKASIYITSIIEDNNYAIDLLTSQRAGLPRYLDMGLYCTTAIGLSRKKHNISGNIKVIRGSHKNIDAIVECLNRNGKDKQFYPYYTNELFLSNNGILRDFRIDNFYIALKNNNVVGTIAKWDQGNFKQTIIAGYKGFLRFIKPFYNLGATVIGLPKLPRPNTQLKFLYTGFIAVDTNEVEIFRALLRAMYNDAVDSNYDYLLVGLHENDPLLRPIREDYHFIRYNSRVFVVCWDDGLDFYNKLDDRIPYLELATL